MRIIIAPAKKMVVDTDSFAVDGLPQFLEQTEQLKATLQGMSPKELQSLCLDVRVLDEAGGEIELTDDEEDDTIYNSSHETYVSDEGEATRAGFDVSDAEDALSPERAAIGSSYEEEDGEVPGEEPEDGPEDDVDLADFLDDGDM